MAVVGIRSRDQIWQLGLVGVLALIVVLTAAFAVRGDGGGGTTAGRLSSSDDGLGSAIVAGPSAANDRQDGDQRSAGAIEDRDPDDQDDDEDESETPPIQEATTSTGAVTVTTASTTTEGPTTTEATTSTVVSTTGETTTTSPPTTISSTTLAPTTKPTLTIPLPSTTADTFTFPTATIGPPVGGHSITREDLKQARKLWRSMGYDSYSMTVQRACFCPPSHLGPFDVLVRGGEVVSVSSLSRIGLNDKPDHSSLTVPGLFDLIESGFDGDRMDVTFDKRTGVPARISIDYLWGAVDDELTVVVSNISPHRGSDD